MSHPNPFILFLDKQVVRTQQGSCQRSAEGRQMIYFYIHDLY